MCPRVIQFLMKIFSGTKAWLGCPFGWSSQCIEVSPIQLLAQDLLYNGWRLLHLEDEWYLKSWVSALTSTRTLQTVLLTRILVKGLNCFACSLHYNADESIPSMFFLAKCRGLPWFQKWVLTAFSASLQFSLRGTKTVWCLVWRNLIFRCFSLCLPKPGGSPQRGLREWGGAGQHRPDALRPAKGSS